MIRDRKYRALVEVEVVSNKCYRCAEYVFSAKNKKEAISYIKDSVYDDYGIVDLREKSIIKLEEEWWLVLEDGYI